jgi:hypothetical protein
VVGPLERLDGMFFVVILKEQNARLSMQRAAEGQ